MNKKLAIFIDWENLRLDIQGIQKRDKNISFNYNEVQQVANLIHSFKEEDEDIYRIFFYTAQPLVLEEHSKKHQWIETYIKNNEEKCIKMNYLVEKIKQFIKEISFKEHFALRLGELKLRGLDSNSNLIINQKQVDMLLGLDISHISYNKLADRILIFSKDTDIVPALKCGRINGPNVFIAHLRNGFKIADKLQIHSDGIRERTLPTKIS